MYRELVKKKYDLELINLKISGKKYADALPETINSIEGPSAHGGFVALRLLCKEISKTHKVVITGEGADEFFGGYTKYNKFVNLKNDPGTYYLSEYQTKRVSQDGTDG